MENVDQSTTEEIQEVSVPGTYMTKWYNREDDMWIYSLSFKCSAPVSNEMLYTVNADLEKEIYQKMLHQMIGLCHQELENSK